MASKLKFMFLFTSIIVIVSMSLLNFSILHWDNSYLPLFSFLEDSSGGIRHTESRHSRIAVIRESDLPFTKMGNYEKSDVISNSYGYKPIFQSGQNWDVPIFEEEMPVHSQF